MLSSEFSVWVASLSRFYGAWSSKKFSDIGNFTDLIYTVFNFGEIQSRVWEKFNFKSN